MIPLSLSVVIPTYNEAERIASTLHEVAAYMCRRGLPGEILIVDDGSTDATIARAEAAGAPGIELRLLSSNVNRGKGSAVRRGMLAARSQVVLFTDADLSTPIAELDRVLPELAAGRPIVIGSRKLDPSRILRRQPLYRQAMGRIFSWLARRLLNPDITDFTCGFKAFRREAVSPLFEPLTLSGWAFDAELLHVARRRGVPVFEIPVSWSNRRETRVRLRRDVLQSAAGILVVLWNGWMGRYESGTVPSA